MALDDHGIDGTIVDPDRRGVNRVDFQLKASTVYQIRNDAIAYDLRVEDYKPLVLVSVRGRIEQWSDGTTLSSSGSNPFHCTSMLTRP